MITTYRSAAVAAFTIAVALLVPTAAEAAQEFNGKVVSSGDGKLVMMVGEVQQEFVVNAETKITLEGKPARLADLMAGHVARVAAELNGDQYIASAVDARSAL